MVGRGSYFDAGRYSFLCKDVVFDGSVAGFKAGGPLLSTPTALFQGNESGGACRTVIAAAEVSADTSGWQFRLSVKEPAPGQYLVTDPGRLDLRDASALHGCVHGAGNTTVTCNFQAKSVKGTWP